MDNHTINWRREERWSNLSVEFKQDDRLGNLERNYPCLAGCTKDHGGPGMLHHGSNVLIFVACSCGWEELVGDHINNAKAREDGRFAFLNHKMDALRPPIATEEKL